MQGTLANVKNNTMYKPDRKLEFLNDMIENGTLKEKTTVSYARIFSITEALEKKFNTELQDFSLEQMEKVFEKFESNNRNTLETYGRIISSYLNWNVKKGYTKENILANFKPTDFEKYLTNNEVYMTEKQLRRYEQRCENYQDSVILRLLFIGMGGKQISEIRLLQEEHIDRELKIIFSPIDENRIWHVDDYTLSVIDGALNQTMYKKRNGMMDESAPSNVRDFTDLVQNNYVVRSSITNTENFSTPVDKFVIYRRIESISKTLGIEELTAKYVQRSGMIHYAHSLMKDGELTLKDLKQVAGRYGVSSYHNLKGFLTAENVIKTYGRG